MIRKFKKSKKFKKVNKKVKALVPEVAAQAANLKNPLAVRTDEPELSLQGVPVITDKTIAEHREEVLSGARRFIYPLQHSKHRIVVVTVTIVIAASVTLLGYCLGALYRFYQYNTFLYRVTQVVPFPIARADGHFVDYENYLFELRHYVHYYQAQQQSNLNSPDQKQQLLAYRRQALDQVITDSYVKTLASANHVSVSGSEVNDRIAEVRQQNRLGNSDKVFADVLRSYWGWSINDFKRALKQQILTEKVVAKLDTATTGRAQAALKQINGGADFTATAKATSDDPSAKDNGGDYGFGIAKTNPNVPPQVIAELFKLKPGQVSGIINAGNTLEIVKLTQAGGGQVTAQHISFKLKDISVYTDPLKKQHPAHTYVKF